jgi:hypothetical protein
MSQKLGETWDNRQGRRERAQNTSTEDRKGDIWSRKRELWRIRTNMEIKDILQGKDIVKFRESLRLRCFGHGEKTAKPKIVKKKLQHLKRKEQEKRNTKDEETRFKRI